MKKGILYLRWCKKRINTKLPNWWFELLIYDIVHISYTNIHIYILYLMHILYIKYIIKYKRKNNFKRWESYNFDWELKYDENVKKTWIWENILDDNGYEYWYLNITFWSEYKESKEWNSYDKTDVVGIPKSIG